MTENASKVNECGDENASVNNKDETGELQQTKVHGLTMHNLIIAH